MKRISLTIKKMNFFLVRRVSFYLPHIFLLSKRRFTTHPTARTNPSELQAKSSLLFNVTRKTHEFIRPNYSGTTEKPAEKLLLSDIDDQDSLRFQVPIIQFYRYNPYPSMKEKDPVKVIREALAKTLVFYYPFAGRLKEGPGRKLHVDCTDQGIMFIEADADVTLEEFRGAILGPPFPCFEKLLYDVPGYGGILNCPLLLIQVTRLKCGGFIVALRLNHTMSDGIGVTQFMSAVAEIARGAISPSIAPVWQRELLSARDPPRVTCNHHEYDVQVPDTINLPSFDDMIHRSFFFGSKEIFTIKKIFFPHLNKCSTFEILTAFLWKYRTIALRPNPQEDMGIICVQNARSKFNPPLPMGYYGNVLALPVALTTAEKLCNSPLEYALQLVVKAKSDVTEEYMKSVADLMVIKGRPHLNAVGTFIVSDNRRLGLDQVDYGWGKPVYGGIGKGDVGVIPGIISFYVPFVNKNGEKEIVVPISLPASAMDRFENELHNILLK